MFTGDGNNLHERDGTFILDDFQLSFLKGLDHSLDLLQGFGCFGLHVNSPQADRH